MTLDVYVCNFSGDNSQRAHALFDEAITRFAPNRLEKRNRTQPPRGLNSRSGRRIEAIAHLQRMPRQELLHR
ncbi:MAG: hypothetical protein Q8N89_14905 [Azonexus sp.]|nr:hypothetical protein [Azonexus sp.]